MGEKGVKALLLACLLWSNCVLLTGCSGRDRDPEHLSGSVLDRLLIRDRDLEILPDRVLYRFSLQDGEIPPSYELITSTNVMALTGLRRNPDYVFRKVDREAVERVGGAASFLVLYGLEESIRLMINGVYFKDTDEARKYADVQETRERKVLGYRRDIAGARWLIFVALDPELTYDNEELKAIHRGLQRYKKRLRLVELFDDMTDLLADELLEKAPHPLSESGRARVRCARWPSCMASRTVSTRRSRATNRRFPRRGWIVSTAISAGSFCARRNPSTPLC